MANSMRVIKKVLKPTGIAIAFLGPDGAGKSTIIQGLLNRNLPFKRHDYFHLKPIVQKMSDQNQVVPNPHEYTPYNPLKSYLKLVYFIVQYNLGWLRNIIRLKNESSLIIFDRYYDDLLVDPKRYRYGGSMAIANFIKFLLPRPSLYFVMTANAEIIYQRKQEVPLAEIERQIKAYRRLTDNKRYIDIDVNRSPAEIINEINQYLMSHMNERY